MLEQLKLYPFDRGTRGKSCDEAVARTISDFSAFVAVHEDRVASFEINLVRHGGWLCGSRCVGGMQGSRGIGFVRSSSI